ncbi:MAG: hypothetical protein IKO68_02345 [Oscillospiraceae bacterium]|nr:hypothetical protein [Oscillospiraceae bacterium]
MANEPYVWYWQLSQKQYELFCTFYEEETGSAPTGFELINGYWYKLQGDSDFELLLMEWDDSDGEGGDRTFISHYWTISQVPAVMWP